MAEPLEDFLRRCGFKGPKTGSSRTRRVFTPERLNPRRYVRGIGLRPALRIVAAASERLDWTHMLRLPMSFLILAAMSSCTRPSPSVNERSHLDLPTSRSSIGPRPPILASRLLDADPAKDLEAALEHGDIRFLGVLDIGERLPGVEDRPDVTFRYGVLYIEGTSCTAPLDIQQNAYDYADVYNRLLLRHLKATGKAARVGPPPTTLPYTTAPSTAAPMKER
jgi:hypothetical protein